MVLLPRLLQQGYTTFCDRGPLQNLFWIHIILRTRAESYMLTKSFSWPDLNHGPYFGSPLLYNLLDNRLLAVKGMPRCHHHSNKKMLKNLFCISSILCYILQTGLYYLFCKLNWCVQIGSNNHLLCFDICFFEIGTCHQKLNFFLD